MKKLLYTVLLALSVASLVGCKDDLDSGAQVTLDFEMVLPVSFVQDTLAMNASSTRSDAGDPGLAEYFERPRYLHLYLAVGSPTTPDVNPVYFYNIPTSQSDWTRSSDSLVFSAKFSQTVNWDPSISMEDLKGGKLRAYMVASYNAYTTVPNGIQWNQYHKVTTTSVDTESELLNLKFYAYEGNKDFSKMSLRDIYSTPFNLGMGWNLLDNAMSNRTNYYGTVTNIVGHNQVGIIALKDTLYHLASKVDFQWDSEDVGQENVMQSIVVNNCPNQGYLFRPTYAVGAGTYSKVVLENESGNVIANDKNNNHEAQYANADQVDPGNQWSGRAYTYLLQPGEINYVVTTSKGGSHNMTRTPDSNGMTNEIFAAWYKLNFRIKASNE